MKVAHGLLLLCCPEIWWSDVPPQAWGGCWGKEEGRGKRAGGIICTASVRKKKGPNPTPPPLFFFFFKVEQNPERILRASRNQFKISLKTSDKDRVSR